MQFLNITAPEDPCLPTSRSADVMLATIRILNKYIETRQVSRRAA
jgi:hypothetical protein